MSSKIVGAQLKKKKDRIRVCINSAVINTYHCPNCFTSLGLYCQSTVYYTTAQLSHYKAIEKAFQ